VFVSRRPHRSLLRLSRNSTDVTLGRTDARRVLGQFNLVAFTEMTYVSSDTLNSAHSLAYSSRNSNNIEHFQVLVIFEKPNPGALGLTAELRESQIVEKMS